MAIFNFPIRHPDHVRRAVFAAREMQKSFEPMRAEFGVGIGIHTGEISFGEFGHSHRDLTAIGTVVNTAARIQSAAEPGQILVTEAVYHQARADIGDGTARDHHLKGFDEPLALYRA
jgi:adenylate cyclase